MKTKDAITNRVPVTLTRDPKISKGREREGPPRPKKKHTNPRSYEEALKELWGEEEDAKGDEAA